MRPRIFTVPFTRLGDFPELEFGAEDTLTLRPLFSFDAATVNAFLERLTAASLTDETIPEPERDLASRQIVVDLMRLCIIEWHLRDADGKTIPIPTTPDALLALPTGLGGAFFGFLANYRGDGPDPTIGS
jgi:hypothetical protein